jgi:hypothetical protein
VPLRMRRRTLVITLASLAVSLFVVAAIAHLGPSGSPDPACDNATRALAAPGFGGEFARGPGRPSAPDLECSDTSGLAYWAMLAGLAFAVGTVVAATLHRAPDQPSQSPTEGD